MKLNIAASFPPSSGSLIFLCVVLVWLILLLLSRNLASTSRRKRSRQLAEKAVRASDPYRDAERVPVDAGTVAGLPQEELRRLTDECVRLGFEQVLAYCVRLPGSNSLTGFGRALVNRGLLCFGEIMAIQNVRNRRRIAFGLDSYLENGWRLGAINRGPYPADYLQRLPKNPRLMVPGPTPSELLRLHLNQRDHLAKDLKLEVLADLSLETRFKKNAEFMALRREAMLSRDTLAELPEARRIQEAGKWEWLGDYPEEMARSQQGPKLRPLDELSPTYSVPQDDALEQMKKAGEGEEGEKP